MSAPEWKDMADWSGLPDVYVTKAECAQGMFWRIEACSVPMAIGPEVRLIRADEVQRLIAEAVARHEASYDVANSLPVLERAILEYLNEARGDWYFPLRAVTDNTMIPPEIVRGFLRMFRDGGLVEFARGLMTDEGEMAGSGYRITDKGRAIAAAIRNRKETT